MMYLGLLADTYIDEEGNEITDMEDENMMATKVHYAITNQELINDVYTKVLAKTITKDNK